MVRSVIPDILLNDDVVTPDILFDMYSKLHKILLSESEGILSYIDLEKPYTLFYQNNFIRTRASYLTKS